MYEVNVERTFAAAHALRGYRGKCENLHGHNYKVRITLAGEKLDDVGLLIDFKVVKGVLMHVIDELDHQNLNELTPFVKANASAENLAAFFYSEINLQLELESTAVQLRKVEVWETEHNSATYFE